MKLIEFYMDLGKENAKQIFEYSDDTSDDEINEDYIKWRAKLSDMYWFEAVKSPNGKIWHNGGRYEETFKNYIS